jgi:NDP-4-keto-2,6-dideoxyhexose 3-C-methyltransferase
MYSRIEACRACGNSELVQILDLGVHALTGVFPKDRESSVDSGPLRLVKCHGAAACGLVQLEHTFSLDQMYGDNYGYRSGLNPTMARHLHDKVKRILSMGYPAQDGLLLDIGSNDGTTLAGFPPDRYDLVGMDPTASKFIDYYRPDITVIADFFSEERFREFFGGRQASVVTSFAMFYDLESPLDFMRQVHSILAPNGVWVFEQSYLPLMLERNSYDTVCHEHLEYYSLSQVAWMASQVGFTLTDVELNDINGGSFSVMAEKTRHGASESPRVTAIIEREKSMGVDGLDLYRAFASRVEASRRELLDFVAGTHQANQMVGALGASTKGNVLLQYCELSPHDLVAIGEVNEDKFGSFTPGTRIPIVPEVELLEMRPDFLLVLPWHFRETFLSKQVDATSRLVFPLPQLEVVDPRRPPS